MGQPGSANWGSRRTAETRLSPSSGSRARSCDTVCFPWGRRRSGAISASGASTKRRWARDGCGSDNSSPATMQSPAPAGRDPAFADHLGHLGCDHVPARARWPAKLAAKEAAPIVSSEPQRRSGRPVDRGIRRVRSHRERSELLAGPGGPDDRWRRIGSGRGCRARN